jgi:hypothetical protein
MRTTVAANRQHPAQITPIAPRGRSDARCSAGNSSGGDTNCVANIRPVPLWPRVAILGEVN